MKYVLYAFAIVFSYRLLKNLFGFWRANYYLNFLKGLYAIPDELQSTIFKIIHQADASAFSCNKEELRIAKGIFFSRIKENFSPFFWLETIWFLPSRILGGYRIKKHRKSHKFVEYLLSAIGWTICFVISLFSDEIKAVLLSFF